MPSQRLFAIMSGDDRSLAGKAARVGLSCAEPFYRAAVAARNLLFDAGWRTPKKLPRPVISVGNITTGGTGKTPMVIELVRRLHAMGRRPAVLLRGYGASRDANEADEAELLRDAFASGGGVVIANPDRAAGAAAALRQDASIDVFILDDGFQHRQVARDLDLVLIDATDPFGHGHVLPRGLLRESMKGLRRASAVIVTRADQVAPAERAAVDATITRMTGRPPLAHAAHRWTGYVDHLGRRFPLDHLRDSRVTGVCGIGNPAAFERSLRQHAPNTTRVVTFSDHHAYDAASLRSMMEAGAGDEVKPVFITTEKDWVKWRRLIEPASLARPVFRPVLEMELIDGGEAVDALLHGATDASLRPST